MSRIPYEFYAKALLARREVADVATTLAAEGYELPDKGYLPGLRRALLADRPDPCVPRSRKEEDWLRSHRIYHLVRGSAEATKLLGLHRSLRIRSALEMTLIGGVTYDEIAEGLHELTGEQYSVEVANLYAHYFWDRDSMSRNDWRAFLVKKDGEGPQDKYPSGRLLLGLLESEPTVALWRVGLRPELETSVVLDSVIADSFMRWQELKQEPNNTYMAVKMERIGNILLKAIQVKDATGGAAASTNRLMHQMALAVSKMRKINGREVLESTIPSEDFVEEPRNVRALPGGTR